MKELKRDLANHYNFSQHQVKFMADSCVFDSFSKAEIESKGCLKSWLPSCSDLQLMRKLVLQLLERSKPSEARCRLQTLV